LYKPLPLFIGLRYFSSGGGGNRLVSFISLLAISGLVLGVCLLIVVLSVMNGFDRELRERILSVVPHVQVIHQQGVADWRTDAGLIARQPSVTEVTPYAEVNGMVHFRQTSRPIQLLGLEADAVPLGLQAVLDEAGVSLSQGNQLLVSEVVAESLNIQLGQRLTLIVPSAEGPTVAQAFTLAGVFATHT